MPSTSGRAATYPRRVDKLKFFNEVKQLRDDIKQRKQTEPGESAVASATTSSESPGSRGLPGSPSAGDLETTPATGQQACSVGVSQSKAIESGRDSDASTGAHNCVVPDVAL